MTISDSFLNWKILWSSDNNAVIEVIPTGADAGKAKALKAGIANVTAKYQSLDATAQTKVSKATLTGIMIEPANLTLIINLKQPYQAIGIYSDTTKNTITEQVNWRIDDGASTVASINEKGIATTVAPGNATVFADLDGIEGSTPLTVIDEALVSIYIEPPQNPYYIKGLTDQLTAYGTYSSTHGNINTYNVTDKVEWSSNKTQVIAINNIDQKGFIQAVDTGHATISIFLQGKEDQVTLFVKAPTLEKIQLQPVDSTIQTHENQRFTARGFYSDHDSADISRFVTWESSNPGTARIDEYGLVTPKAAGTTEIAAIDSVTKVRGSTGLTVNTSGISKLKVLPNTLSMGVGVSKPLLAKATFLDGTEKDVTALATWESLKPSVATVNNTTGTGIVTGHEVGDTSITAGFEGEQSSAAIEVIKHELDHILIEPEDANLPQGVYTQYKATAVYTDMFEEDVTHDTNWSVSASAIATINSKGLVLSEAAGTTHIIANFQGKQTSTLLTVTDLALQKLLIIPDSSVLSFVIGEKQPLIAEGIFASNQVIDMTRSVVWVSNKPDVLSVIASGPQAGLATAHAKGSATITVYSQQADKTASMTYTVSASTLNSINIAPVTPVIPENYTVNFSATGSYADGIDRDITADCFWQSQHPDIAPITQLGVARTQTAGKTEITASYKNKSASSLLTVVAGDAIKSITITPSPATIPPYSGLSFKAEATFYNGNTLDITKTGKWASSNKAIASIFNMVWTHGKVWAWGPRGDTEISITYKGVTAKTTLTVK